MKPLAPESRVPAPIALDPVSGNPTTSDAGPGVNAAAYSVSELASALKRTLEDAYGFVRLRGEISKVTRHASGHVYLTLKDERACLDAVVWKTGVRALACQPQTGLEVIVTGRITTYAARSSYQLVIETMAPSGTGALLAQLERLKAKLRGEGLFEEGRKRALPQTPAVIGVITSPTGAVIRDILHRLRERWPSHVLVWPVVVQGADAARQVAAAVRGFNALDPGGPLQRPDVLIIARGGGSIEDLWPFNDETLARTVAASAIPLISAVGHETDVTLVDFVADRRAPTPTAAAEIATPVLAELKIQMVSLEQRISRSIQATLDVRRTRLKSAARGLPRPADLLGLAAQRFDQAASRLAAALRSNVRAHETDLARCGGRLSPHLLERPLRLGAARALELDRRKVQAGARLLRDLADRVERLDRVRRSLNPDGPLVRGFARVHRADASLVRSAGALSPGDALQLVFQDGRRSAVVSDGRPPRSIRRGDGKEDPGQGRLL